MNEKAPDTKETKEKTELTPEMEELYKKNHGRKQRCFQTSGIINSESFF